MKIWRTISSKYANLPITVRATFWFIICSTIQKAISIITTPIFTRLLSTEQYGLYSVYNSWMYVFTIITAFRLDCGVFNKAMSKYKEDRDGYTSAMQGTTTLLTAIVLFVYLIFHNQINKITELSTFITLAMFLELFLTPAITFWTLKQRYEYRYKSVVLVTVAMSLGNAILGIAAVLLTSHDQGVARILSCVFIQCSFGLVIYIRNLQLGKKFFVWKYAKYAILFNIPLMPHYMSTFILEQSDRIMIQKMVSISAAGIYSVAYSAGMVMKIITTSATNAIIPWQYERLEKKEYKEFAGKLYPILYLVSFVLLAFIAVAPEVMIILASPKYYEAVYCIPPVTASIYFIFLYSIYNNIEFFFEENKYTMFIAMSGAVLNIILNYILIKIFGYTAAAYTTLICYILFTFLHCLYVDKITTREINICLFDNKRLLLLSIIVVAGSIVMSFLYKFTLLRYILMVIILVYAVADRKRLLSIVKGIMGSKRTRTPEE